MNSSQIMAMQRRIGVTADGFWGPLSIHACQKHLFNLMRQKQPWPRPDSASLESFFGAPGDESQLVNLPVGDLWVKYDGNPVRTIRCNKRVAESLDRVLREISAGPHAAILSEYAGCFNFRRKRGGHSYSLHAYGAAIDLNPDENTFRDSWPMRSTMPLEVMEAFAREGWKAAGAWWGYDAMHFECTG